MVGAETGSPEGDPWQASMARLGAFIRARRADAGLSLRDLAARTGVSNAYLSQVERGLHEPSVRVLHAIAGALDVPFELLLTEAGLLGGAAGGDATAATIMADPLLTGTQKYALVTIYRSFVGSDATG